jgi:arylformamidase
MHIYDITLTVSPSLPVWPGHPSIILERIQKIEDGAHSNVSRMAMTVHSGTHVDAPFHFLGSNSATVDQLALKLLTGRAYVIYLPDVDQITAAVLKGTEIPPRTRRILFKTRNSSYWADNAIGFQPNFVGITADAAEYLIERGIKLVGVDYLSVAPYKNSRPTHEILLKAGVVIVEGLNLSRVSQGRYTLYCLPLKLEGLDGAPARAILIGV